MPTAYAPTTFSCDHHAFGWHPSTNALAVILFSLVGLTVSAALITYMGAGAFEAMLGAF